MTELVTGFDEATEALRTQGIVLEDKTSEEIVQEGQQLLIDLHDRMPKEYVTDEQMIQILLELISNTSFSSAKVEFQDYNLMSRMDHFEMLRVTVGNMEEESCFNVWFARVSNSWVLKCNRIPPRENLRGA
ncbi:MAG: hypothetical protein UX04_C0010G0003 [Microgenomates group bacterium GW2011_GWF2_45_18]|nr:MAG: hypothetical protein UW18_C0013G0012 [Microgenomates group bacterium GW2011_GWF1_44_10]KKU01350.1 MAG: hypothetical protein UX04_C0010G0003 [Microgenomates group bacterium GW2011_GWF2_45_18]HAU99374.1 hypothetical protein [Candidatus Paceibacterota bacterium]HAX01352.1 hypothetical protein [Candidatus Paceibacterota bacterium]